MCDGCVIADLADALLSVITPLDPPNPTLPTHHTQHASMALEDPLAPPNQEEEEEDGMNDDEVPVTPHALATIRYNTAPRPQPPLPSILPSFLPLTSSPHPLCHQPLLH